MRLASATGIRHTSGVWLWSLLVAASGRVEPVADADPPAQPPADRIAWSAPPECPDDAELERRVADAVDHADAGSIATATVQRAGDHYTVDLVTAIDGAAQLKHLEAADCDDLADAVAVVVALTLDPATAATPEVATQRDVAAPVDEMPPPAVETSSPGTTRAVPSPPPTSRARLGQHFELGLRFMGGFGSGLAPVGGGVVSVALSLGRRLWIAELDGRLWTPRDIPSVDRNFGASMLLGTVGLAGCLRPPTRRVEVPLCLGLEGGAARAKGRDLLGISTEFYPWAAPFVRVGLRVRIAAGVGFLAAIEAAIPIRRPVITVGGADSPLWSTPAASARVLVGLQFRTPGPNGGGSR